MRSTQSKKQTDSRRWRTAAEVEEILVAYWESGHTQRVFARAAGMSVSTLRSWLRRVREPDRGGRRKASEALAAQAVPLLEVELAQTLPGAAARAVHYEIEVNSGVRLRVPEAFREAEVRSLLRLVGEIG
jgi:transposase-like protein